MNQADAYKILADELGSYRETSHTDLREFVGQSFSNNVLADDGTVYLLEVSVSWSDKAKDEILVDAMVAVSGSGPLRRMDRSFVSTENGIRPG